ncbi:MAG TPA: hypothetical protein VGD98_16210 [Ktedonobacteraceae bacterium]
MANFVLLYSGGSGMAEDPAALEAANQAWGMWFGKLGGALIDAGQPFAPAVKSIKSNGSVIDGPIGSMSTGYSVLQADSLSAAVELARDCPIFLTGGDVSVYEALPIM